MTTKVLAYQDQVARIIRALDIKQESNPGYRLNQMARIAMDKNRFREAFDYGEQALQLCIDLKKPYGQGIAKMLLGTIYLYRNDNSENDL